MATLFSVEKERLDMVRIVRLKKLNLVSVEMVVVGVEFNER